MTKNEYKRKIKKRIRTLVIPYVIWNIIYIIFVLFKQSIGIEGGKLIREYTLSDFVWCFWDYSHVQGMDQGPIYVYLWFVRDLFIVSLFTPLMFYLYKKNVLFILTVFLILLGLSSNFLNLMRASLFGVSLFSFIFYIIGVLLSLKKIDISIIPQKFIVLFSGTYVILVTIILNTDGVLNQFITDLSIYIGIPLIIGFTSKLIQTGILTTNELLINSAFFLYLSHPIILPYIRYCRRLLPHNDIVLLLAYLATPLITILLLLVVFNLLKKLSPIILNYLTGGRS